MCMVSFDFLSHMYIHMDKPSVKLNIILYPPSIPGHHRFSFASYKTVDTKYICDGMVSWHIWLGECSSFLASSIKLESTIIYIMSVSIPIFVCCGDYCFIFCLTPVTFRSANRQPFFLHARAHKLTVYCTGVA